MIPKILHYCWFGNNDKSEKINYCIESWKKYLPDYEIIEWNERNFDVFCNSFVQKAYEQKKWAFITDYVRAYVLYNNGGIYLDTDVEITGSLDEFLFHKAFSGFELKGYPFTALWGSEKWHHWPKKVLDFYSNIDFDEETNTVYVSKILEKDYGIDVENDSLQIYNDDIYIYPSNYFCLNIRNFAIHHFEGSWVPETYKKKNVNENLFNLFIVDHFIKNRNFDEALHLILVKYKISRLELVKILVKKIFQF